MVRVCAAAEHKPGVAVLKKQCLLMDVRHSALDLMARTEDIQAVATFASLTNKQSCNYMIYLE